MAVHLPPSIFTPFFFIPACHDHLSVNVNGAERFAGIQRDSKGGHIDLCWTAGQEEVVIFANQKPEFPALLPSPYTLQQSRDVLHGAANSKWVEIKTTTNHSSFAAPSIPLRQSIYEDKVLALNPESPCSASISGEHTTTVLTHSWFSVCLSVFEYLLLCGTDNHHILILESRLRRVILSQTSLDTK